MSRRRPVWMLAILSAVLLISGAAIVLWVNRSDCLGLTLWSSDEKATQLREVARRYGGKTEDGRCIDVTVTISSSRMTADLLATDPATPWELEAKPDMWSPSSSVWIERLRASLEDHPGRVHKVGDFRSLVTSPVVIAMPRPMAEALGWPEAAIGWRDLLALANDPKGWGTKGHPEWGRFKIGKTNPAESTTGLLATTATATALAGAGDVLTIEGLTRATGDLRALESATVHYGRYVETFVGNLYEADSEGKALEYVSAIAMEEKVVLDYNKGILVGNPPRTATPPKVPLAAIFPSDGTMVSDNPAMVVDADWVPEEKRRAANDFLQFARENRQVFLDAGFRDDENKPGAVHTPANGTVAQPDYRLVKTPPTTVIEGVREVWRQTRRRANILMVIDVSGSMNDEVVAANQSRLELAKLAAKVVPGHLAADDQLALWEFSSELGTSPNPWRELVALGAVDNVRESYLERTANLQANGQTALYATTRAAVGLVTQRFDPSRINAVIVLSDGKNEYPRDDNLDRLLGELRAADKDRVVRVFTIAYGQEADAGTLAGISKATRAHSFDAKDATTIEGVMLDVLSNF